MERKSMGAFLAALRKANGLTQQQVADRLHVSDKAVSRWERDTCSPDLSVIPALAELFGITCDELLRGERRLAEASPEGDRKVDRQVRALVSRALASFRTLCWVSLALSVVGFVCMLGIAYGFYRPIVGFAVLGIFAAVAALLGALAVNRLKTVREDNELFDRAEEALLERYARCLGEYSFAAFFGVLAAVVLSLPLVLVSSEYLVYSVLSWESYLPVAGVLVVVLGLGWAKGKPLYVARINGRPIRRRPLGVCGRMTLWQVGLTVAAVGLFALAPYFERSPEFTSPLYIGVNLLGLFCLFGNFACFGVFAAKHREQPGRIRTGIRNGLYAVCGLVTAGWHNVGFSSSLEEGYGEFYRYDYWDASAFWWAVCLALLVTAVFAVVEKWQGKGGE